MPMDDQSWTVVVRRRASMLRRSVCETTFSDSSKTRRRGQKTSPLQPPHEDRDCDEALLLIKLKRSMERVQESAFFKMLIDQVQTPPVLSHLRRAASASGFDVVDAAHRGVSGEGNIPASLRCSHNVTRSSAEGSMLECACSCLRMPCETIQKEVYCDESKSVAKTWRCQNFPAVECVSYPKIHAGKMSCGITQYNTEGNAAQAFVETSSCVCVECEKSPNNGSHNEEIKHESRHVEAACSAAHIELGKGLTCINGIKGSKQVALKQRPCHQISKESWCLQVILYGLGSIADSEISRCQFALILLLKQSFSWVGNVEVYDPVLSQSECKVIADMGCLPISVDEKGRRSISRPTLFYMPHCEDWLYDNVLQANWVPHTLGQLVILGNSFRDYQDRWSAPIGQKSKPPFYVKQYQQVVQEIPLKATFSQDLPGFNNMSWHFYPLPD